MATNFENYNLILHEKIRSFDHQKVEHKSKISLGVLT